MPRSVGGKLAKKILDPIFSFFVRVDSVYLISVPDIQPSVKI